MAEDAVDRATVRAVLNAAQLTRRVFSPETLRDLQPDSKRGTKKLKPSGAQALFLLETKPGLTVTELAKELSVSQAAMSFAVTRLSQAGYVESVLNPHDKRSYRLEITALGRACVAQVLTNAGLTDPSPEETPADIETVRNEPGQ